MVDAEEFARIPREISAATGLQRDDLQSLVGLFEAEPRSVRGEDGGGSGDLFLLVVFSGRFLVGFSGRLAQLTAQGNRQDHHFAGAQFLQQRLVATGT